MTTPQERLSNFTTSRSRIRADDPNAKVIAEMAQNRAVNAKRVTGSAMGSSSGAVSFATERPRDPMYYWEQNNLPYQYWTDDGLDKIRRYARGVYLTHPVVGAAIDVYSKLPVVGLELTCKDDALTDFYGELFFDDLGYEDFLIDIGREYWTVGEAFPLGSFNETLGVWDDDELIDPRHVEVHRNMFSKEPRFEMELPDSIRNILEKREPVWEYESIMRSYPELMNFLQYDQRMEVSNVLMKHIRFAADPFFIRGLPILMRGFRTLLQEEMLNAAQDAVASRLYTPLVIAKIGASAQELGTKSPWIPTRADISAFEESLDAALAADFRILTTHFATNVSSVFGRETMPRFNDDHDRMTERLLQVFGLSKTMLSGGGAGETYAADAINRDLVSMLLTTYRRVLQGFFRDRALVVAEAQEHFDYEERGGKRYVVREEVLVVDEETGEVRIEEQPKLLVPDLRLRGMNLKDEQDFRQFVESLRSSGVPISMQTRLANTEIDIDEEVQRVRDEQVAQVVEAEETRKATYVALRAAGLPIPQDLIDDFAATADPEDSVVSHQMELPTIGDSEPGSTQALAPTDEVSEEEAVDRLPQNKIMSRPDESDEMRKNMPKPAYRVRIAGKVNGSGGGGSEDGAVGEDEYVVLDSLEHPEGRHRLISGPSHIGARRFIRLDDEESAEGAVPHRPSPTKG